jgi:hypothetical protein
MMSRVLTIYDSLMYVECSCVLLYHIVCFVLSCMYFVMSVVIACLCATCKDIDLFPILLLNDSYWICETYMHVCVYMYLTLITS